MPAARLGPQDMVPQSHSDEPKIFKSEYRHNLIDTSVTPLQTVITQTGGYPLIVDYYAQKIGRDQDVDGFNLDTQTTPLQQYCRIRNVKFKLSSPINYQMTGANSNDVYSGDGKLMIPGIVPKEGDQFLADIGQGRLGAFTVSNPLALSQYDARAYQFDFKLTGQATIEYVAMMDARVVQSLNYVEDLTGTGVGSGIGSNSPLLTDDALNNYTSAQRLLTTTIKQYMAESFSHENSTLQVPGQFSHCYDPYLVNFVMSLIEVEAHPYVRRIKRPNVDDFKTVEYIDILSVLLDRDSSMLPMCFTEVSLRPTSDYSKNKQVGSIAYSGFDNVVYPIQRLNGPYDVGCDCEGDTGYIGEPLRNTSLNTLLIDTLPMFDTITGSDGTSKSYIFSPSFYDGTNVNESVMTMMVRNYLNGQPVDSNMLLRIMNTRLSWSAIDRFYYTPILIMLLRAVVLMV